METIPLGSVLRLELEGMRGLAVSPANGVIAITRALSDGSLIVDQIDFNCKHPNGEQDFEANVRLVEMLALASMRMLLAGFGVYYWEDFRAKVNDVAYGKPKQNHAGVEELNEDQVVAELARRVQVAEQERNKQGANQGSQREPGPVEDDPVLDQSTDESPAGVQGGGP